MTRLQILSAVYGGEQPKKKVEPPPPVVKKKPKRKESPIVRMEPCEHWTEEDWRREIKEPMSFETIGGVLGTIGTIALLGVTCLVGLTGVLSGDDSRR